MVTGITPDRITTDGHDSYPRAIRTTLGEGVLHRDNQYLNNRLEQDHRGVKGRYGRTPGARSESPSVRASRLMSCARAVSRGVSVAPDLPAYH